MRNQPWINHWKIRGTCLLALAAAITSGAAAQIAPAPANAARQAIENRKSVFTLIGTNFRPIGEILRGNLKPESVDVGKYTSRVAFLATFVDESFPEISRSGDTRAKPEIWSDHDAFEKRVKDFQEHTHALSQLATGAASNSDAFKAAARTVVQDCQGCHDSYRNK